MAVSNGRRAAQRFQFTTAFCQGTLTRTSKITQKRRALSYKKIPCMGRAGFKLDGKKTSQTCNALIAAQVEKKNAVARDGKEKTPRGGTVRSP
jgi:hypothetical protein